MSGSRPTALQRQAFVLPDPRPDWAKSRDWDMAYAHLREGVPFDELARRYQLGVPRVREIVHQIVYRANKLLREQEAIVRVRLLLLDTRDETLGCPCRFCRTVPLDGAARHWSCPHCGYTGRPLGHPCTCADQSCTGQRRWQRREGCAHGEPRCPCCGGAGQDARAWALIKTIREIVNHP